MKWTTKILLAGVLSALQFLASGQSQILEAYIQTAQENNLEIRSSELMAQKQSKRIDIAKKNWMPRIDLSTDYLLAKGGRKIIFPVGDLFNPAYSTLNDLTGTSNFPTNLQNYETQLTPNNYMDAQISISKPLINSSLRSIEKIQIAKLRLNEVDLDLVKEEIRYQVKTAYFNYLKSLEGLSIIDANKVLLQNVLRFNKKLVANDQATNEIISNVEYEIEELNSQYAMVKEQSELAKAFFNLLVNRSLAEAIEVDSNLLDQTPFESFDLSVARSTALRDRHEFKKIQAADVLHSLDQERINLEKMPELNAFTGVGLQTEDFNFNDGGPLFMIGIGMKVNLFDGGLRKNRIEEIQIERDILMIERSRLSQQIELEVTSVYFAIEASLKQLVSHEAAVKNAQTSYQIIRSKYENGAALLIELLQAQNRLSTSKLSRIVSKYDYLIKRAELQKYLAFR